MATTAVRATMVTTAVHGLRLKELMSELQVVTRETDFTETSRVDALKSELEQIKGQLIIANEKVKIKEQLLGVYKEVGDLMWSADEFTEKASRFVKCLFDATPFHRLILTLIEEGTQKLKIVEDLKRVQSQPDSRRVRYEMAHITEQTIRTREVRIIDHPPDGSVVALPVETNDKMMGVVMLITENLQKQTVLDYARMLKPLVEMSAKAL